MKLTYYRTILLSVAIILALISPISAMIELKWTVKSTYAAKTTTAVVVGKVAQVDNDRQVAVLTLDQSLKGKAPGPKVQVVMRDVADYLKIVAAEQPIVLIQEGEKAFLHVADTWFLTLALPNSNMLAWRAVKKDDTLQHSFPGRTSALVQFVNDQATGRDEMKMLDEWKHKPFAGGMKQRAKLPVKKAAWILSADLNGDKKADLLVNSAAGTQVFIAGADGFADATAQWGALGNAGGYHATGDVNGDGKPDVLLDGSLWLNQGQKFTQSKATFELPKGKPLAAALLDVNGDQKLDALFLDASGDVRIYENPGAPDKPWTARPAKPLWTGGDAPTFAAFGDFGDTGKPHALVVGKNVMRYALDADGGPPADFTRLTGSDFSKMEKYKDGLKNPAAVCLQMNGEPRPDLFLFTEAGTLLLLNRGLGAFFLDETAAGIITAKGPLPLVPSPSTAWTRVQVPGKFDNLLLLGEDGTLFELENAQ